jgi:hypothetical protein
LLGDENKYNELPDLQFLRFRGLVG